MSNGYTVEDVIAITGHRDYPDRAALYRGLDNLRANEYIFGGARGVDSDALEYIKKTQPRSLRTVVVPDRVINQPAYAREMIRKNAIRVIELRNTGPDRFQIRNRYMVDRSSHVRAFYDFRGSGGTYNTIQYARRTGKPFSVQPMFNSDLNHFMRMSPEDFKEFVERAHEFEVPFLSIKGLIMNYLIQGERILPPGYVVEFGLVKLGIKGGRIVRTLE